MTLAHALVPLFLVAMVGHAADAAAGGIDVHPVQIHLSETKTGAVLTIGNEAGAILRVQLSASAWDQDAAGEMVLAPTTDIIFFPSFLELDPGTSRKVRIGTTASFAATEKTYRLFVEELSPPETELSSGEANVLPMRTRIGLPIFLVPRDAVVKGELALSFARGTLLAEVRNRGRVHFVPTEIRVRGLAKTGEVRFERSFEGWYVLAGGRRTFQAQVPAAECRKVAVLVLQARVGEEVLVRRIEADRDACGND